MIPNEAWANLYDGELPSTWYRSRALADRMSGKHRTGVLHFKRIAGDKFEFNLIEINNSNVLIGYS
jgi:hypothetical protein